MHMYKDPRGMIGSDLRAHYYSREERKEWYQKRFERRMRRLEKARAEMTMQFTLRMWKADGRIYSPYGDTMTAKAGFTLLSMTKLHRALGYKEGEDDPKKVRLQLYDDRSRSWISINLTTLIERDQRMPYKTYLLRPVTANPKVVWEGLAEEINNLNQEKDPEWLLSGCEDSDEDEEDRWIRYQRMRDGLRDYTEDEEYYGIDADW